MPKVDFDSFLKELKAGVKEIAKTEAADFVKEATSDGKDFLQTIKADLKKWTRQRVEGKLSKKDLEFLVQGKQDLAKMEALKQAGLAAVRVDRIRVAVIDLILSAAEKLV
jgi:hypothetical protein